MILVAEIVFVIFQLLFISHPLFITTRASINSWLIDCTNETKKKQEKYFKKIYFVCYLK